MRDLAMKNICSKLMLIGIDLSKFSALEFFAREGDWQTTAYANKVKSLEAWEIDPKYEEALRKNLPEAIIRIGDSFKMAESCVPRFNFIVFDNPMGIYDDHCEHFEALELLPKLLKVPGIVIFNINKHPYGENPEWEQRRLKYYNLNEPDICFYSSIFRGLDYTTEFAFEASRNNDYLYYLVFGLK